ncbi:hypothetical protein GJ496_001499 [Pomphorhynchus laevis]|nr:hypothetical protein GJ496_001499 [Pomphorhynchus laevis]
MVELDRLTFLNRLNKFYQFFNHTNNHNVGAVCVIVGQDGDASYSKSIAIQTWFFDCVLRDTLIILCKDLAIFLASAKKLDYIRQMERSKENLPENMQLKFFERKKQDVDEQFMSEIIELMEKNSDIHKIGVLGKDKSTGPFADKWRAVINAKGWEKVDFSMHVSDMMAVKDEDEILRVKKAAELTSKLFLKYLKDKIVDIVDCEQKIRHSKLTDLLNETLNNQKYISNEDSEFVEFCYPPIFQSGDNRYSLKYSASSDDHILQFGAVVCMFGIRYKSYCSNVGRTFLIFPTATVESNYQYLLSLEEKLVDLLREGVVMCDVHKRLINYAKEENENLSSNLTPIFGFLSGIEFKDGSMVIGPKCRLIAKKGMVFQIHVGLSDLTQTAANLKGTHALFLADTVLVEDENTPATVLTTASKRVNTISVKLREDDDEEMSLASDDENGSDAKGSNDSEADNDDNLRMLGTRKLRRPTAIMQNKTRKEQNSEQKRLEHQKELAKRLHEAAMSRLMKSSGNQSPEKVRKWNVSYKHSSQFPSDPSISEMKIFVDKRSETVVMPVYAYPCPFHISTIKNVSLTVEGDYTYLRINFFHPGAGIVRSSEQQYSDPNAIFVKELTYRASNIKAPGVVVAPSTNLHTAFRLIKDVQKHFKEQEAEKRELEGVIKQDALITSTNKNIPRLKDLCVRPNITQKRMSGYLETHQNGVRYTTIRGDHIDILFSNVKHAFYQPCDNEMIILLHFHLTHPIIFGKKKQIDIQFYAEVGELATDLNKTKSRRDRDDIGAEQAERDYRQKLKSVFRTFIERLESSAPNSIAFETPFRDLGFHGTPYRSMVLLVPTSSCLVNLTEWPPFVISLEEIELVHFERVQFHLKNFDMVFIFKDYSRKVVMINSIPMSQLDVVKDWLNSCDIKYTEGIQSLNWTKVMKAIVDDIEGFFESGGWNFLEPESEAEGSDKLGDDDDDVYQPSDLSDMDESSESEYENSAEDDSIGESDGEASDEDGSSGKSWSELEEEARRADMEKGESDDENDSRQASKKKKRGNHTQSHSSSSAKKRRM